MELVAGTDISGMGSTKLFSLFTITIQLTEEGFDHLDDVLEALFAYLKLVKSSGPNESTFHEMQTMMANGFRFPNEQPSFRNVQGLVLNLKQYPPKYVLTGDKLMFEYDAGAIQKMIDELCTRRFNIMITSTRRYSPNVKYELTEPWFGTMYTEMDMPDKWISSWNNPKQHTEFMWPQPNPFITEDFTIFYKKGNDVPKYPTKILDNDLCELWFRQDDKFLLPIARYQFYFRSPILKASIRK